MGGTWRVKLLSVDLRQRLVAKTSRLGFPGGVFFELLEAVFFDLLEAVFSGFAGSFAP